MSGHPNRSIPGVILRAIICINGPNDTIGRNVINKNRLLFCFGEKEIRVRAILNKSLLFMVCDLTQNIKAQRKQEIFDKISDLGKPT